MNTTSTTEKQHSNHGLTVTNAITTTSEVTIDHAALGTEAWNWDAHQQTNFLAAFANTLRDNGPAGLKQIAFIADSLREDPDDVSAIRWLADELTHALEEDGTPYSREEVTAGYVNPSQERLAAWEAKLELTR